MLSLEVYVEVLRLWQDSLLDKLNWTCWVWKGAFWCFLADFDLKESCSYFFSLMSLMVYHIVVVSLKLGAIEKMLVNPIVLEKIDKILQSPRCFSLKRFINKAMNSTWPLIRLIVAEAGSNCADLREFFLRRLGSSGRLLLFAVLKTTPIT